jgi:hypothetical protein
MLLNARTTHIVISKDKKTKRLHLHLIPHANIKLKRLNIELQQYFQEEANP